MSTRGEPVPATDARAQLADLVNRVAYAGERIPLSRHGRIVAALVSADDLARLERSDDVTVGFAPMTKKASERQDTDQRPAAAARASRRRRRNG